MLQVLTDWLLSYQDGAPYLIFSLLLLTGCSVPISEDLLIIVSGVLAGSYLPDKTIPLFMAAFLGSYFSDTIAYAMGRYVAKRASKNGTLCGIRISPYTKRCSDYFDRWGIITLIVGRMIPFGFRNGIFMTAGAGKMSLFRFLVSDGISCALFSFVLFWLSFHAGLQGGDGIEMWLSRIGLIVLVGGGFLALLFKIYSSRKQTSVEKISL